MINRRILLALPLLLANPARAEPADPLVAALITCWQARGVRFTPEQVAARIGARTGRDALLAVAGAWTDANDDDQETMVEIVWEAGAPPSPAEPLLTVDLVAGRPALLFTRDGEWWLLHARNQNMLAVHHPLTGQAQMLAPDAAALIGRPVIAGA
ncbi:hypothetical protein [Sandarakinorhabdus limnophila]|uniref:hypothetical protein n=1 Tax=Sandarakinorhabdus limnophila TaxID=210512 RepID=UPI0026EF1DD1|nr:hypothetical protein [Sandarakinorhabdus limnophila]